MPSTDRAEDNLQNIRQQFAEAQRALNALEMQPNESLYDFEYRVKDHSDKLLSLKIAEKIQQQLLDQEVREAEEELKKKESLIYEGKSPYRVHGWHPISVLFLGGNEVELVSRFFVKNKKRSDESKGFYPGLALLGITERMSPSILDLLAKSAAALGSYRDAEGALADQGIKVSHTRISTAVRATALKARSLRTNGTLFKILEFKNSRVERSS